MIIGTCKHRAPTCNKIGYTIDEWLDDLSPELYKGLAIQHKIEDPQKLNQLLQELKDNFPKGGPYVFTRGDLNLSNIIVSEGKITGIVDWEWGGFYPWWVE
jgi:aminoglycoside phosphotransferase (APT) family kinase protein